MAVAARAAPSDLASQYLYAVALGVRTELERGRAQLRKAEELHRQVERVLSLDPDHAGALYIQGRLNAAVMRLSRIRRFLATRLFGGAVLASASWEKAQRLLEAAVREDPCVPDHHLELARVYAETGDPARARAELDLFFGLLAEDDRALTMEEKGRALMRKLGGPVGDGG
jgi:predicted Zn-dependent protease